MACGNGEYDNGLMAELNFDQWDDLWKLLQHIMDVALAGLCVGRVLEVGLTPYAIDIALQGRSFCL